MPTYRPESLRPPPKLGNGPDKRFSRSSKGLSSERPQKGGEVDVPRTDDGLQRC